MREFIMQVKVITVSFMESDIWEGSLPMSCYDDADVEFFDVYSAQEAADLIKSKGLSFKASGGSWAADPDGSQCVDYATGEREEVTAHLFGPAWFHRAVTRMVG